MSITHKIGAFFIFLFLLLACKNGESDMERTYEDTKIIAVMIDLYTAEAALKDIEPVYLDSLRDLYKSQIEKIHNVDMVAAERDIVIIQSDLDTFLALQKAVQDSLTIVEKNLSKKPKVNREAKKEVKDKLIKK